MNSKINKVILVTGGAGFLGSHLCKRLVKENNNVICVDNRETGSLENIEHLLTSKNFKFIEQDIINEFDFKSPIDEIFNLACPASPINYQKDPVRTNKTSVIGILKIYLIWL